jgi:AraC-like DNA-binding protein
VLSFERDEVLLAAVRHYLAAIGRVRLQSHRLMEILLLLVEKRPALLSYVLRQKHWSRRVRAILASDLTVAWDIAQVCRRLATTESTLRRHLKLEDTGFRELLYELRLSSALAQLLQTPLPISRVAYDCGYQSVSRFSSNFHKRYGLSPRALREAMSETGHTTPVSGQIPAA